jgi:hypothetical protein
MTAFSRAALGVGLLVGAWGTGCTHNVKVAPIKVEPIDITLHIYLEADEKLDSFFAYQDQSQGTTEPATGTPEEAPAEGGRP